MKSRFKSKQLKKTHRTLSELDFIDLWNPPTLPEGVRNIWTPPVQERKKYENNTEACPPPCPLLLISLTL